MKRCALLCAVLMLVSMAFAADSPETGRKHIVAPERSKFPFSDAVLVGDTLYVGGHIGIDPKTGKPGATPEEEAKLLMEALKHTVESAGMTLDDLVSVQVFCSDVSFYDAFNQVYRTYFHAPYPARAFLGSGKLLFGARFELNGIAVKKSQ